jgi:flagellar hook-associated protein 3 FlgL
MSISVLSLSRTPNSLASSGTTRAITAAQERLNRLQVQLGTGVKFTRPSESPTAATQTIALQKLDERASAYQAGLQTNLGFLAVADQSLGAISDALNQARGLLQAGVGDQVSADEREGLAQEVQALIQSIIQAANTSYNGRPIFAGSQTDGPPFEQIGDGLVRYNGNGQTLSGWADFQTLVESGVDGVNGLGATTTATAVDLNPAVTLATRLDELHGGQGVALGNLQVILDDANPGDVRRTVDLSGAETLQDIKNRIEAAFPGGAVAVGLNAAGTGLRITPVAGTVEVRDLDSGTTAAELGLRSGPVATLQGTDLDPTISLFTPVGALNGGTGVGLTTGFGLRIENGGTVSTVDLNGAATVQDLLNRIRAADPNVIAEISADGRGLSVTSRLSGANFSIGENGGDNATRLGLRTFTTATRLADLNLGVGVPGSDAPPLKIIRRDGTEITVDLSTAATVQDVIDAISTAAPGLVVGLNAVGNGISLQDPVVGGPLTVVANEWSVKLGLNGTENTGPAGVLAGRDVNPQQASGAFNVLTRLEHALRENDTATLQRLSGEVEDAYTHVNITRGELGNHQRQLESIDNLLEDRHVQIKDRLSKLQDVDLSATITEFLAQQQAMQAYLQIASQTLQVSILQYL